MIDRRDCLLGGLGLVAYPVLWAAAEWPIHQPIKVVVPFSAGGAADILTRQLCDKLSGKLGAQFVVENKTGAGGNIGMEAVKSAQADGYTLASATVGTLAINPYLFAKLNYDPAADFIPVSLIWENCNVFVVSAQHPAKSVAEFLAWAKKQSKGVNFASSGVGTTPHLAGELFKVRTGVHAEHIPFRGASQSMPALIGGDVDFAIDNIASYFPMIKAGKVRALAITANERWPTLPEVPTMAEVKVPDFIITSWGAFVMPKGTPMAIVNRLSSAIQGVMADATMKQRFMDSGAHAVSSTPAETVAFADQERKKWRAMVKLSGATAE